jgi:hypothetical protein
MTAATPDQHGVDHVNEQPFEYWIAKFHARGFWLDERTTTAWRMRWSDAKITACYSRNVLVFKSASPAESVGAFWLGEATKIV